jgi:hypothetical protein
MCGRQKIEIVSDTATAMAIHIPTRVSKNTLPMMNPSASFIALDFVLVERIASCVESVKIGRFGLGWVLLLQFTLIC